MLPTEYDTARLEVAAAVRALERALADLATALLHRPTAVDVPGSAPQQALRAVCDAYTAIDLGPEDVPNQSVVALGVIGVDRDCLRLAERVNDCKAALREICAPLQRVRRRVPVAGGGTEAIPVVRAMLRSIQRSDLNLLAAYRRLPILGAHPKSISYTRARTRAVYRKTVAEIGDLLQLNEAPAAIRDRERLASLRASETHLALVRDHYENIRANIVYAGLDRRGRGRVMISAELPILYLQRENHAPPLISYPEPSVEGARPPRKARQSKLEEHPWLESLPVYRYRSLPRGKARTAV